MGDMADLAMDQAFDAWCNHEDGDCDQNGYEHDDSFWNPKSKKKTCYRCGMKGLVWGRTTSGWRLFEQNKIHTCKNGSF